MDTDLIRAAAKDIRDAITVYQAGDPPVLLNTITKLREFIEQRANLILRLASKTC